MVLYFLYLRIQGSTPDGYFPSSCCDWLAERTSSSNLTTNVPRNWRPDFHTHFAQNLCTLCHEFGLHSPLPVQLQTPCTRKLQHSYSC